MTDPTEGADVSEPSNGSDGPQGSPFIPRRVAQAGFLVILGLLVLAVVIGLIRDQINVDGLVIALMPVLTGVILGGVIRTNRNGDGS